MTRDLDPGTSSIPASGNKYVYALSNPPRYADPTGLTTLAIGVQGEVAAIFGLTGNVCAAVDGHGNLEVLGGWGGGGGASFGYGGFVQITDADKVCELEGSSLEIGGSNPTWPIGADYIAGLHDAGPQNGYWPDAEGTYRGININFGPGVGGHAYLPRDKDITPPWLIRHL